VHQRGERGPDGEEEEGPAVRVIVTGSRDWRQPNAARHAIANRLFGLPPSETVIVVGYNVDEDKPRGVDRFAYQEAQKLGLTVEAWPAEWMKHDYVGTASGVKCHCRDVRKFCRAAGFRRNQAMVSAGAGLVLAFWNGKSSGTQDTIDRAKVAGIPVEIVEVVQA
jgi:hypothetical protein